MKYFTNIKTLDELKKAYRKLAAKLHPDNGGSTEEMKKLNAEYDEMFKKVKNFRTSASGETYESKTETTETAAMFREVIEKIINLNVDIDICGSWVWVTGSTYEVKDILKAAGFRWANNKKAWYWHSPEDGSRNRKKMTLDEIKALHGCESVKKKGKINYIPSFA